MVFFRLHNSSKFEMGSYDEASMSSEEEDHQCKKCKKSYSTKYTLERHLKNIHGKKKSKNDNSKDSDESDSEDTDGTNDSEILEADNDSEPSNYIWRRLMKRVLRNWNKNHPERVLSSASPLPFPGARGYKYVTPIPQNEEDLITESNLKIVREDLYNEMMTVLNNYQELTSSPLYQKILKSKEKLEKTVYDSDTDDDNGEAWQSAYDFRKTLVEDFIEENKDIVQNYDESTDEEEGEEMDDEEESDS